MTKKVLQKKYEKINKDKKCDINTSIEELWGDTHWTKCECDLDGTKCKYPAPTTIKELEKPKAKRYNNGKLRFSSAPWRGIKHILKVSSVGAIKYGPFNYKNGFPISELENSALRHLFGDEAHEGYFTGEALDPESGLHHLAHACWNFLVIIEQLQSPSKYNILDDRYKEGEKSNEPE